MLCPGLLPKAGAVDHHHVLLQNELLHKHIIALRYVDTGIRIERTARRDATYTRRRIAPLDSKIAAAAKLLSDFDQVIGATQPRRSAYLGLLGALQSHAFPQVHSLWSFIGQFLPLFLQPAGLAAANETVHIVAIRIENRIFV